MEPVVISQSTDEPITVAEAAANLRLDPDGSPPVYPESSRIQGLITAARIACENDLEVSLVAKTLEISLESWYRPHCQAIELPYGPVRSIESVKYIDSSGNDTTLDADQYRTTIRHRMAVLIPAYGVSWPATRVDVDSIRIRYLAGYPSTDSPPETVPSTILQAMHLYIAHYFVNREAVDDNKLAPLPLGAESLLWFYRQRLGL